MDRKRSLWVVVGVAALALVLGSAFYLHRPKVEPQAAPAQPQAAAQQSDAPLPPAQKTDADARKDLAALSSRPEWARWLAASDLLDRWVVVVDNVAEDVSPRKQMDFIEVSPQKAEKLNYARYDAVAEVIASIDAKGLAQVLREIHPLMETAYHKLGYPDRKFNDVLARALKRVIDAPVMTQPPRLEPKGANFRFADDKLESLGPVEKHLLRMGPRNTKLVQGKARELAAALDLRIIASH
ncbi:MAG TPA: DUF3014 domain-containing protein [Myxococcales bacterium]|jgi:hypothetical protein|nr:DUF3014 domain-containing protein [Myxococcales bacterium]